jgi:ATP-dependent HslUV protease subunit HslV
MSVTRFKRFDAIGSGSPYALGALHALYEEPLGAAEIARRACAAAIYFDADCGGEIDARVVSARGAARRKRP